MNLFYVLLHHCYCLLFILLLSFFQLISSFGRRASAGLRLFPARLVSVSIVCFSQCLFLFQLINSLVCTRCWVWCQPTLRFPFGRTCIFCSVCVVHDKMNDRGYDLFFALRLGAFLRFLHGARASAFQSNCWCSTIGETAQTDCAVLYCFLSWCVHSAFSVFA